MKQIDRLLITSFLPPFVVTFGIATFVLVMQILWVYIDDIAGKGLGALLVIELLAYKCVGLAPMALPIAILLSSVMVLGGLAERYELSSFKSAGVPLTRVMRPLVIFGIGSMFVSYYCADYLIPAANLKFGSRMHDIQRKKPALSLDAGVFNDDFTNYAIHIGRKDPNGRTIYDVLIYDHSEANTGKLSQIVAAQGEMFSSADNRYFVMQLHDGNQYAEAGPAGRRTDGKFPFVRTSFKTWTKIFDLSEFQLARTNEQLFTTNRAMMSSGQLREAIDSIEVQLYQRRAGLGNFVSNYLRLSPLDSSIIAPSASPQGMDSLTQYHINQSDSLAAAQRASSPRASSLRALRPTADSVASKALTYRPLPVRRPGVADTIAQVVVEPVEMLPDTFANLGAWVRNLPKETSVRIFNRARSASRSIESQAESADRTIENTRENLAKFTYELHTKYSLAVVCIIFVFIGAPMGAIVRKGGFGYPILVSIIFFILFIVLTIFCRKIAETFIVPAAVAAWIPCMVLFPIGLWLSVKAMNDSRLMNFDRITYFFNRLRFARKQPAAHAADSSPA